MGKPAAGSGGSWGPPGSGGHGPATQLEIAELNRRFNVVNSRAESFQARRPQPAQRQVDPFGAHVDVRTCGRQAQEDPFGSQHRQTRRSPSAQSPETTMSSMLRFAMSKETRNPSRLASASRSVQSRRAMSGTTNESADQGLSWSTMKKSASSSAVRGVDVAMSRLDPESCFTWNSSHERHPTREKLRLEGPATVHALLQEPSSRTQSPAPRKASAPHGGEPRTSASSPVSSRPSSVASSIGVLKSQDMKFATSGKWYPHPATHRGQLRLSSPRAVTQKVDPAKNIGNSCPFWEADTQRLARSMSAPGAKLALPEKSLRWVSQDHWDNPAFQSAWKVNLTKPHPPALHSG